VPDDPSEWRRSPSLALCHAPRPVNNPVSGTDVRRPGAAPDDEPGRHDHVVVTLERAVEQVQQQPRGQGACSRTGWATVVRSTTEAISWSCIPITDTRPGTATLARRTPGRIDRSLSRGR
jgi:hypothetical protein